LKRVRRSLLAMLADLAIGLCPRQPDGEDMGRRRERLSFGTNVSRLPLRMTEFLRDRLRGRWLRLRRKDR